MRATWETLRTLLRARDNVVAAWPKSFYRRPHIRERLLGRTLFIANSPETVDHVMVANARNYRKSPANTQTLRPLLGDGLFVSEGELWARQRRILNPSVHTQRLPGYTTGITACGQDFLDAWDRRPDGTVEDATAAFTQLTAEVISRLMFRFPLGERAARLYRAFLDYQATHGRMHFSEFLGLPAWLPRPSRWRGDRAVREFDAVIHDIITTGRARPEGVGEFEDLLRLLIDHRDESGQPMPPRLIRDEVASMFLAGHETTAITLTWAFWLLERHPDSEARLHAELDNVLAGRTPDFADVPRLEFTRAVVEETLRLFPPVHVFSRQALGADTIAGEPLEPGAFVVISAWVLHRHTLWWEEPTTFRPERFLPANAGALQRGAYIPFGAGPRACLGRHLGLLESVILLAMIAQRYRLRLHPAGHPVEPIGRMTLRPSHGMPMAAWRRRS
jgi:cytochrome P450